MQFLQAERNYLEFYISIIIIKAQLNHYWAYHRRDQTKFIHMTITHCQIFAWILYEVLFLFSKMNEKSTESTLIVIKHLRLPHRNEKQIAISNASSFVIFNYDQFSIDRIYKVAEKFSSLLWLNQVSNISIISNLLHTIEN